MDVKRLIGGVTLLLLLAACDNKKTSQTVFPGNNQKNGSTEVSCQQAKINNIPTRFIVTWEDGHISVEKSENSDLFVDHFVEPNLQAIHHVEYDRWIYLDDQTVQTSATTTPDNDWGQRTIQLDAVHAQGVKGQGILVAIVDTPVDYTHPQLKNRMVPGWDFVTNTAQATAPHEHATHIAGVIAAEEGGQVKGLAPQSQVMGVSFMDASGSGALSGAVLAMNYAADHGAKVINNSWGGPLCSEAMRTSMKALSDKGVCSWWPQETMGSIF